MQYSSNTVTSRIFAAISLALLQAWVMVLCISMALFLLRLVQMVWHWPTDFEASWSDISTVLLQGARFDLKVSAAAAVLLLPLLAVLSQRFHGWVVGVVAGLFIFISLVNLHYFGFYKTTIDPTIFGFFEDDTKAIVQTIWSDFPVVLTLAVLFGVSAIAIVARKKLFSYLHLRLARYDVSVGVKILILVLSFLMLVLTIKGTLRAMALGRQNVSVTTSQFLNDMVPNGAIALKFAWNNRRDSQNFNDPLLGLRQLGFNSPAEAANVLGIKASDDEAIRAALKINGASNSAHKKNLVFVLMESWSAEPIRYQANDFDVLGRLNSTLSDACHFSNFESAQPGTHPTLEALLFSTPITPLTLGKHGSTPIPWATPLLMKQAGFHTLFVTSARSGWRNLDRVLKTQGFDEVVDANTLKALHPEAPLGIWGVWDSYVFDYVSQRLQKQDKDKPLFVFVLTSTNHPPYDLPSDYQRVKRNMEKWEGERNFDTLEANLDTYHYSSDLLGGLVEQVRTGPLHGNTIIAATGDHNARSFGLYTSPERHFLETQVPFIIWGDKLGCGTQRELPAGHRDMFPTLFPLVGVTGGYINTGRNLLASQTEINANKIMNEPVSVSYFARARDAKGIWTLGNSASFGCSPVGKTVDLSCKFNSKVDLHERARLGLLDWNVRSGLQ